ncbi:MAG: hypothetical protein H0U30_07780 [Actinobacteria bacterium]|nr:hypothetical protein [Actinomycetota bacterium]
MKRRPLRRRLVAPVYAPTPDERVLYVDANNRVLCITQLIGWLGLGAALFLFALNSI